MLTSFSEFKFYQSYRINVEQSDGLRFIASMEEEIGREIFIDDAKPSTFLSVGLVFKHAKEFQ